MKIYLTRRFEQAWDKLPQEIQKLADEKIALMVKNVRHPSFRVKRITGTKNIWEISVTMNYRMTFEKHPDGYLLRNVGTHDILKKKDKF